MKMRKHLAVRFIVSSCVFAAMAVGPVLAESASGLSWTAPAAWKSQGARPMRAATYVVPASDGDKEPGECAVYFFGGGQGGSVGANIKRWLGQFQTPDGGPVDKTAQIGEKTISGIKVTTVDVSGTYLFKPAPMAPRAIPKPGYRMLAAIAQGAGGPIFFKLTAPEKTAHAAQADFEKMLESLRK
jgi:hypothetical protein